MHDLLCKACTDRGLVYSAKGRIVSNSEIRTLYERPSIFIKDEPVLSSERMLHKKYDRKGSVEK
jgi:hypothetical protein